MNVRNMLSVVLVSAILVNLLCGLLFAIKLYSGAPENEGMGFSKYWNALMMDASPGDKTLLKFEGDRLRLFLLYRKISLLCIGVVATCGVSFFLI